MRLFELNISVVIPLYNQEDLIITALDSVFAQTYKDSLREIIVVDDGSSDRSAERVRDYAMNHNEIEIRLLSQANSGVSAARNAGVNIAKGDWIAFLDDDDIWLPQKIEMQCKIIDEHPEIDFLGCDHDDIPLSILGKKITSLYRVNLRDLCLKSFPVTPAILVRKQVVYDIGGFDESLRYMEDARFCFKVSAKYGYYHLPLSLVKIDIGKRGRAVSGLSSHLKEMHYGEVANLKWLYQKHLISVYFYLFLRIFNFLKYIRRIFLRKMNNS